MHKLVLCTTERLELRQFTADDALLLYHLDSDPEVMRYISKGKPTPLDHIKQNILPAWLKFYEQEKKCGFWAAIELQTQQFIGWFHLRPDRITTHEMELGYRLKRSAWGKGYATEGSQELIHKAFTEWDVPKISARTLVENKSSQRVMQKCGLQFQEFFSYSADLLPSWTEDERKAIKYGLSAVDFVVPF